MRTPYSYTETRTVAEFDAAGAQTPKGTTTQSYTEDNPFDAAKTLQRFSSETLFPLLDMLGTSGTQFDRSAANRGIVDEYSRLGQLVKRTIHVSVPLSPLLGGELSNIIVLNHISTNTLGRLTTFAVESLPLGFPLGLKAWIARISYNEAGQPAGYVYVPITGTSDRPNPNYSAMKVFQGIRYNDLGDVVHYEYVEPLGVAASGPAETPWQRNASGALQTNLAWNYNMGYQFIPQVNGRVTKLGGLFNGTKTVRLYDSSGSILALADVTSANAWAYTPITPVAVEAGKTYTVAVNLAGSGGSYRRGLSAVLPQTFGKIQILRSVYRNNSDLVPTFGTTSYMYGQADIEFVPSN